ncbi:hypothetical protein WA158_003029 [Blastocystis sp. Blastoise]
MKIITGDETGLIKQVIIEQKKIQRWGVQNRELSVERMRFCGPKDDDESQLAVALKNGCIKVWDMDETKLLSTLETHSPNPKGLDIIYEENDRKIISCSEEGHVCIFSLETDELVKEFDIDGPVATMHLCPYNHDIFAAGGKENDLKVYSIEKGSFIWRAKNVPNDFLDLRVPVWIKDLQFMECSDKGYKIITVTGYNQIRIYNTSVKRQPIEDYAVGEHAFVTCRLNKDQTYLYVSDIIGRVVGFNLSTHRIYGVFKGNVGSVRDIQLHPSLPLLATVGLDRILRIYDIPSRDLKHRIYLRQRLNTVVFGREEIIDDDEEEEDKEEEENRENKEKEEENEYNSDFDALNSDEE